MTNNEAISRITRHIDYVDRRIAERIAQGQRVVHQEADKEAFYTAIEALRYVVAMAEWEQENIQAKES